MKFKNPLRNKKGVVLAMVVVMSAFIMILCSTVTILTTITDNLKRADRKVYENSISVKNEGERFISDGTVSDDDSDGLIDDISFPYSIFVDGNKKALFIMSQNSENVLLIVTMSYDGAEWNADGWYENTSDVITVSTVDAECETAGSRTYSLPNGMVYKTDILPATGHDYNEGVCTRCGGAES